MTFRRKYVLARSAVSFADSPSTMNELPMLRWPATVMLQGHRRGFGERLLDRVWCG
jgi:hypothetical protein